MPSLEEWLKYHAKQVSASVSQVITSPGPEAIAIYSVSHNTGLIMDYILPPFSDSTDYERLS